eukprot:scaffold267388_cov30-Tisochrysis_lutea.AAC.1
MLSLGRAAHHLQVRTLGHDSLGTAAGAAKDGTGEGRERGAMACVGQPVLAWTHWAQLQELLMAEQ